MAIKYYNEENIVLHDYKAVYLVNHKVASTSLKFFINDLLGWSPVDDDEYIHHIQFPYVPRKQLRTKYNGYFKFSFVRNPWDRVVSCYKNKISPDPNYNVRPFRRGVFSGFRKYRTFRAGMSFPEFVGAICEIPDHKADHHFKSQMSIFMGDDGEMIPHYVGKMEDMDTSFNIVCRILGVENTLQHRMKTSGDHYREYYTDETKRMVASRYKADIAMFKYTF